MFSRRARQNQPVNMLTTVRLRRQAEGLPLLDLTLSNPTLAGFDYPRELIEALIASAGASYDPDPRGARSARETLAAALSNRDQRNVSPEDLILNASTSEAY